MRHTCKVLLVALCLAVCCLGNDDWVQKTFVPALNNYKDSMKNLRKIVNEGVEKNYISVVKACSNGYGVFEVPLDGMDEVNLPC